MANVVAEFHADFTKYTDALAGRMDTELAGDDEKSLNEAIKDWKKNGSY